MIIKLFEDFNNDDIMDHLKDIWDVIQDDSDVSDFSIWDEKQFNNGKVIKFFMVYIDIKTESPKLLKEIEKKIKFTESFDDIKLSDIAISGKTTNHPLGFDYDTIWIKPHSTPKWEIRAVDPKDKRHITFYDNEISHPFVTKNIVFRIRFSYNKD